MSPNKSTDQGRRTMSVVHPNAAAIDVGATMHMAAVNADRTPEPVCSLATGRNRFTDAVNIAAVLDCNTLELSGSIISARKRRALMERGKFVAL